MALHLRRARERRKWTQEDLERESGVDQGTISKLENHKYRVSFDVVLRIAHALGLAPQDLRFGPDPKRRRKARVAA